MASPGFAVRRKTARFVPAQVSAVAARLKQAALRLLTPAARRFPQVARVFHRKILQQAARRIGPEFRLLPFAAPPVVERALRRLPGARCRSLPRLMLEPVLERPDWLVPAPPVLRTPD